MKQSLILLILIFLSYATAVSSQDREQKDLLAMLREAGASKAELDTLEILLKTNASDDQIQSRIRLFWNSRYQKLSDEEKVIYANLADSTQRIQYLSCKNDWDRRLFLRKLNKEQKQKLWKTEEGRILYFSLKLAANKKELEEFLRLPDSLKQNWLYTFWKKKDPNPTTEENEFKQEFDGRVEYVLYNFWVPSGQLRPWDDRGDVYILYGEPDDKEVPKVYFDRLEFKFRAVDVVEFDNKGPSVDRLSVEVWHYFGIASFQFEDRRKLGIWELNVYRENDHQTPKEALAEFMKTTSEKVGFARVEYIPDLGSALDFPWNWWKFWNQGDYYDVRVNLSIPIGKLGLLVDSNLVDSGPDFVETSWLCFQERVVLSDNQRKTIASDSLWVKKKVSKSLDRKDLLLVDQYSFDSLSPGFYSIAISIKDSASNRMGIYQDTSVILVSHVKVKASEKISQLIMADSVWLADSSYVQKNGLKFIRNNLVIKPRPGNVYAQGQSPSFYCEIYELKKDQSDSSRCRIYYSFLKKDKDGKFLLFQGPFNEEAAWPSSSLNQNNSGQAQPYIKGSLSPDKFPAGEYIIRIDVYDLNDPNTSEDQIRKTVAGFKIG